MRRKKPLKRTPFKRKEADSLPPKSLGGSPQRTKKRKALKPVSESMKVKQQKYRQAKIEWWHSLPEPKLCQFTGCKKKAEVNAPHHKRGRAGALLWDARFFMAICRSHHVFIHNNPSEARELGFLAPPSEWNVVPRP